jgi:nucleoside 2-deoxyribosyltransferase
MLITKTALFIGYSLSDPDFANIRSIVRERLGRFERMSYLIQFDADSNSLKKLLSEKVHVINIKSSGSVTKDDQLASVFGEVLKVADARANSKLRMKLPEAFEQIPETQLRKSIEGDDFSPLFTGSSNLCFVMMSFNKAGFPVYSELIKPASEKFGLSVFRADDIMTPGVITEQIRAAIQQSRICIADISGQNPNVLYEVGLAQAIGKPVLLLAQDAEKLPFDLSNLRVHVYNINHPARHIRNLEKSIEAVLGEDRSTEAKRLIDNGMYRAAAAILGVLLEHALRQALQSGQGISRQEVGRPISLSELIRLAKASSIISNELYVQLRSCIQIRNTAVHDLKEPTKSDVMIMYDVIKSAIKTIKKGK